MSRSGAMNSSDSADVVVVGGGTVGAWTAVQLAERGVGRVVLLEAKTLGAGASSRAAGMVRAQGGTETAVRLGMRTQDFYRSTGERFPLDCGFVSQGYLMPCFSDANVAQAHARIAMQRRIGLDVQWLSRSDVDSRGTGLAPGVTMGASYAPGDGYLDASRNVLAYTAALIAHRVDVRERCAFTGLRTSSGRVTGVETVNVDELPMVFDVTSGIYWRPGGSGGLLWGMSNPEEQPGESGHFDHDYYEQARARIEILFPAVVGLGLRRTWAATIDYTSDHTPILGPLITDDGPVTGTVVASPAGHGMMWGPAVAEAAADLVTTQAPGWISPTWASTVSTRTATAAWHPIRFHFHSRKMLSNKRKQESHERNRPHPGPRRRRQCRTGGLGSAGGGHRRADGDPRRRTLGTRIGVGRHLAVLSRTIALGAGNPRGHLPGGRPDDGDTGRRSAQGDRGGRYRGVPTRLVRDLGHPRDRPQGLLDLLIAPDHQRVHRDRAGGRGDDRVGFDRVEEVAEFS